MLIAISELGHTRVGGRVWLAVGLATKLAVEPGLVACYRNSLGASPAWWRGLECFAGEVWAELVDFGELFAGE